MWVEKTEKGYRAVERYLDPISGTKKKVSTSMQKNTSATRKIAEKVLAERIAKKTEAKKDNITFKALVDEWLNYQKTNVKPSSYTVYRRNSAKLIDTIGSKNLVNNLTARHITQKISKMYTTPSRQNFAITLVKSIIKWGYENDYIESISWLDKVKLRKNAEKKKSIEDKYLEGFELEQLINSMSLDKWRELTLFLALTGMRIGEALAIRYTDISMEDRIIHITRTYSTITKDFQSAKTKDSIRDIYIQDELMPLCTKLRARASANRFVNTLLFPTCTYTAYIQYLTRTSQQAIEKRISPHALRHTHVALLAEKGIPLETISRRLGHSDTKVTKEVYFHVTKKLAEKDYQAIKEVNIL